MAFINCVQGIDRDFVHIEGACRRGSGAVHSLYTGHD